MLPAPAPVAIDPGAAYHVLPGFLADAQPLRDCIDRHFAEPDKAGARHQVWDYWHVPDAYTYLRTSPEKVIERALVEQFMARLQWFSLAFLGMDTVTWPNLSLYVEGCGQVMHNDSRNGSFGYVYSLTHWDRRRFSGGETLIFREQDYWASGRFRDSGAGSSFYETIPAHFNQLLLFDDRLIHGVPQVRGVSDAREARLVLHGHIHAREIGILGPLGPVLQREGPGPLAAALDSARALAASEPGRYHGFVTCALDVAADGSVTQVRRLVQRVLTTAGPQAHVPLIEQMLALFGPLRFAPQAQPSRILLPFFFA